MSRLSPLVLLLALPALSPAASTRALISEGNSAYEAEQYEQALEAYQQAEETAPELAVAAFNRGAAHYRRQEYDEATAAFQQAARLAAEQGDADVEALAEYNLGNALYRSSGGYAQTDPKTSLAALEKSVASYKDALRLNPELGEAARNMELARLRMKELLERLQQQPSGGQSNDPDDTDDLQQKLSENLKKQQELNRQRDELEEKQQRNPRDENLQKESQELSKQQKQLEHDSREMAEQLEQQQQQQQQPDPQKQQAQNQLEQAAQQQQQASEQLDRRQLAEAEQPQDEATQNMQQALDALQGKSGEAQQQQQPQQPSQAQNQKQQQSDPLQALRQTPQDILNEERVNRRRRELLQLGTPQPVEKDW